MNKITIFKAYFFNTLSTLGTLSILSSYLPLRLRSAIRIQFINSVGIPKYPPHPHNPTILVFDYRQN